MDIYEKNKIKAKYCLNCIYLHIGIEVDHNHCDGFNDSWYDSRANGHHRDKYIHKKN